MKTKVVIVDDHKLIAKAISSIVNEFEDFEVIYEVENGLELVQNFKSGREIPVVVLLDISMPVMDGFETAKWIKENHPTVLIMALSMQDDEQSLFKMINNGAKGYMHKNIHPQELEIALKTIVRDGIFFPGWATQKMYTNFNSPNPTKAGNPFELSLREEEFLKYVCLDITYKEIGDKMCCSPRTVDGYRDSLFLKIGVNSRVALALFAVKYKYFDTSELNI